MSESIRIAVVVSHPVQHFCPQYVSFAENKEVELKVFFASALGYKKYVDPSFNEEISWGNLNLDKFAHEFLNGDKALIPDKNIDALTLDKALDNFDPQLVITYGYFQKLQRRAKNWAKKKGIQVGYISDSELRQRRNAIREIVKYPFLYYYFSQISYFLTVGNSNEEYYRRYGVKNSKIIRMHFPIDLKNYQKSYAQRIQLSREIRRKYKIKEDDFVISVVGKLVLTKNQDHIIHALRKIENQTPPLHFFVIGSGEMAEKLKGEAETLANTRVHFTGFLSPAELPSYYAASDVYIHPSLEDRHPLAVSEAIYMGCPIIISNTCGSYGETDDVQPEKNGFVYEFGNIDQLSGYILKLANERQIRDEQSRYSHSIAKSFQEAAHYTVLTNLLKKNFQKVP